MTFAEVLPHLLAGHDVTLGNDPLYACRYRIHHERVQYRYPHWDRWLTRDYIALAAIKSTAWNYAPADSPANTPPSA